MRDLDDIANDSLYTSLVAEMTINYSWEIFKRFIGPNNKRILELGPAEGCMTRKMLNEGHSVLAVDGSLVFVDQLRKLEGVEVIHGYFEKVEIDEQFDCIVLGHVLEHVESPVLVLERCLQWLAPKGIVLAAVPNVNSLHRKMAVEMGIIDSVDVMSKKDIHHGHLRHYSRNSLADDFIASGYSIVDDGGYWLKILPDEQLERQWSHSQLTASFILGESYPDIAAEIWVVATASE